MRDEDKEFVRDFVCKKTLGMTWGMHGSSVFNIIWLPVKTRT